MNQSIVQVKYLPDFKIGNTLLFSTDVNSIKTLRDLFQKAINQADFMVDLGIMPGFKIFGPDTILIFRAPYDIGLKRSGKTLEWKISLETWDLFVSQIDSFAGTQPGHHYLYPRIDSYDNDIIVQVSYSEYDKDWWAWKSVDYRK